MWKLVGVIGLIVICAGLDLLWQSRREVRFWITTFVGIFRLNNVALPPSYGPSAGEGYM
jgi:hypothetical protein